MKAIKIDVIKREVYEIDIPKGLQGLYSALECDMVEIVRINDTEDLYVDEEGLLRHDPIGAFRFKGYDQVLSGHGLVLGNDGEGDSVDTTLTVEYIRDQVRFKEVQDIPEPFMHFFPIK